MDYQEYQTKQPLTEQPKKTPFKSILFGALILLIALVVFMFFQAKQEKPYEVLTPVVYPEGTTVSLYKNAPSGFPSDLILEDVVLDYSGVIQNSDGDKQITVSYISDKDMPTIAEEYSSKLEGSGWEILNSSVFEKVSIFQAMKNSANLTITIAPIKNTKTMVTFQYENN